jgi:hypothetical protein
MPVQRTHKPALVTSSPLAELRGLDVTELQVALDFSGVKLSRRMTVAEIAAAAADGVATLGQDTVRALADSVRWFNERLSNGVSMIDPETYGASKGLWTSMRRHDSAGDLAWRVRWAIDDAAVTAPVLIGRAA